MADSLKTHTFDSVCSAFCFVCLFLFLLTTMKAGAGVKKQALLS